ncbi:hypothetical protein Q8A67_015776 [Cirrhinus molitorella]|uniref:Cyclin-dependent kinases regulatory subunit n=1 Tax=Cirrhinus molitorella TaxID=172907 RepID=A0AA88PMF0_9TELE|nr:hypothetical protein Q8A67_015776 [Cirrhinus molitorella]
MISNKKEETKQQHTMSHKQIFYSDKYDDDKFEYRHVMLPKDIAKRVPKTHLMSETEWRNLGVQQSQGWVHYMIHQPEPHILLFRPSLKTYKGKQGLLMAFCKVEDCDEWNEESKEKDFHFKSDERCKMGEKSDYEPMVYEEDNQSMDSGPKFAVVTLQDTDEVMVVALDWLSTDQKQCYWPPFKSPEKYLETVKGNLEPSTGGKPWEKLNVIFHGQYDTYKEAVNNQVEQRALKDGLILYKVVTLQKSDELTVIPATWLNEERKQCFWPPFKSPEKCTEAVKNRLEPPVTVKKPWEILNIQAHWDCATYKQAKEKQKQFKEQSERFFFKSTLHPAPSLQISQFSPHDMEIMEKARNIMKRVTDNLVHTIIMHNDIISKINKMYTVNRKKATIGIFGRMGEGKSSLLSAVLGEKDLLPSGCFGACTSVITQVEANLNDSNYTAEIELISKEEWETELKDLFRDIQDESEDGYEDLFEIAEEKITALYGADADQKTLEELKKDDKYAEIENLLSNSKITISNSDVSEFSSNVAQFIQHSMSSHGGWYWPLVKSVNIKIPNCHELLEHSVIVDIPGSGDCNKTRNDLWKSKLRECSSLWIVSGINRATVDKDPWRILKHCIEELGPGGECKHINFICTKTDDINPVAYMSDSILWIAIVHQLQSKNLSLYGKAPAYISSYHSHFDRIWQNSAGCIAIGDQKKTCILHRNEHAKSRVKEKFESSEIKEIFNTDNQFQVFTVSSDAFFDHSLNLESSETEIPKLQDDLRSLNKSINRDLARDYVNKAKGHLSLIQSGQLDKDKKMIEMKVNDFRKILEKSLIELDRYFDSIYNDLEQHLSNGVKESVNSCVDSTKKLIIPNTNGRGFHKILGALCKNYGCYWSKNWDVILNLNKTLAKHLHKNIHDDFCQIFPVTGKTGKSVQEQIDKFSIIQNDSAYPSSDILHHIHNYIKIEEIKLKAALNRDIVERKKDIYLSIQITIVKEMASCYQQAAAVKGTGSLKKMQELLITTVDEKKQDMFNKAKMEVLEKLNNLKLDIRIALENELQKAIERSQSQTSERTQRDFSREIQELERLQQQLSD